MKIAFLLSLAGLALFPSTSEAQFIKRYDYNPTFTIARFLVRETPRPESDRTVIRTKYGRYLVLDFGELLRSRGGRDSRRMIDVLANQYQQDARNGIRSSFTVINPKNRTGYYRTVYDIDGFTEFGFVRHGVGPERLNRVIIPGVDNTGDNWHYFRFRIGSFEYFELKERREIRQDKDGNMQWDVVHGKSFSNALRDLNTVLRPGAIIKLHHIDRDLYGYRLVHGGVLGRYNSAQNAFHTPSAVHAH